MAARDESDITTPKTESVDANCERKISSLTKEGYGNVFLAAIDKLDIDIECPFCFMVIRDATQISACGHSFCATCWNDWSSNHGDKEIRCPVDNELVDMNKVFQDTKQDRYLQGLRVFCDNQDSGCRVTPELRYLQVHLDMCQYKTLLCELGCGQELILDCLQEHMVKDCPRRMIDCLQCGASVQANTIASHAYTCPMSTVPCEYCHTEGFVRHQLPKHHEDCLKFPSLCSFALVGCTEKVRRDALNAHHEAKSHDHLRLLNASQLYHTTGVTAGSTDSLYELPASLRGKVCEDGTNGPCSELPGCAGESQEGEGERKVSLREKVDQLEEENNALKKNEEGYKRSLQHYQNDMEEMKISMQKMMAQMIDTNNAMGEMKRNYEDVNREMGDVKREIDDLKKTKARVVDLVAFSVGSTRKFGETTEIPVPMEVVLYNDGGHYHHNAFHAPVKGVYSFTFSASSVYTKWTHLILYTQKQGEGRVAVARAFGRGMFSQSSASSSVIIKLDVHERVSVWLNGKDDILCGDTPPITLFCGELKQRLV